MIVSILTFQMSSAGLFSSCTRYHITKWRYHFTSRPLSFLFTFLLFLSSSSFLFSSLPPLFLFSLLFFSLLLLPSSHFLSFLLSFFLFSFKAFGLWLSKQTHEYKYVIDGANVAYHHQNFKDGRFSYRQIELIVDKIKEKNDGKILVLLPQLYTNNTITNSSYYGKNKSRHVSISEDDKVSLSRLDGWLYGRLCYVCVCIVVHVCDSQWVWVSYLYLRICLNNHLSSYLSVGFCFRVCTCWHAYLQIAHAHT